MADQELSGAWRKWPFTPQSQEELLALARMLRRAHGTFVLAFAHCNIVPLRERLVEALQDLLTPAGMAIYEVKLTAETLDLPAMLATVPGNGNPLFVYELAQTLPPAASGPMLRQLNERRSVYQKLGRPLVFWLPEYTLELVARGAPDFWAWRSGVYEFTPPSAKRVALLEREMGGNDWVAQSNLDRTTREHRLHLLRNLLDRYTGEEEEALRARATTLHKLADIEMTLVGYGAAESHWREALHIYEGLGDQRGIADTQSDLARLLELHGDYEEAERLYRAALEAKKRLGYPWEAAITQSDLARLLRLRGDYEEAEQLYRIALETLQHLGDRWMVAVILGDLVRLLVWHGDYEKAERLYSAALEELSYIGDRRRVALVQNDLAYLFTLHENYEEAERLYRAALETFRRLDDQRRVVITQSGLAHLLILREDYEEAKRLYHAAMEILERMGDRRGVAIIQSDLARLLQLSGDYEEAEHLYCTVQKTFECLGDRRGVAIVLYDLALLRRNQGQPEETLSFLNRSHDLFAALGLDKDSIKVGETIAEVHHSLESYPLPQSDTNTHNVSSLT